MCRFVAAFAAISVFCSLWTGCGEDGSNPTAKAVILGNEAVEPHPPQTIIDPENGRKDAAPEPPAIVPREGMPDVFLIIVDTLRFDYVQSYGSELPTTPFLKELSRQGVLFEKAYATSSWTVPSMFSVITGLYPREHGVDKGGVSKGGVVGQPALNENAVTLTERLDQAGYETYGICTNHHLHQRFGFAQGFDHFVGKGFLKLPFPEMAIGAFEETARGKGPNFFWLHYFDPHFPYRDNQPWFSKWNRSGFADWGEISLDASSRVYRTRNDLGPEDPIPLANITRVNRWAHRIALSHPGEIMKIARTAGPEVESRYLNFLKSAYASEVARVDQSIRKVFKKLGVGNDDLVIVTSDHGEEFDDHGSIGHRWLNSLHEELVRVPLLILLPGRAHAGKVVTDPVSLVDIMPTVLEVLELEDDDDAHSGVSLLSTMNGDVKADRVLHGELDEPSARVCYRLEYPWKYIHNYSRSTGHLYNLATDPKERRDLAAVEPGRAKQMLAGLDEWMATTELRWTEVEMIPLSSLELERLRAMGYVL